MSRAKTGPKRLPLADRLWAKVNRDGPVVRPDLGPCWLWTGGVNRRGYGKLGKLGGYGADGRRRTLLASRVAWTVTHGDPGDLLVCHHCDNPPCCNPAHLFVGTQSDNLRDAASKGRMNPQRNPDRYRAFLDAGRVRHLANLKARPDPVCIHCERVVRSRRTWAGRCGACNEYFRRHGVDRPPHVLAGLGHSGPWSARSALTVERAAEIRARVAGGERQVDVARSMGLRKALVNTVVKGRHWTSSESLVSQAAALTGGGR